MNPSFRGGHGRRASALRVRSVWPLALGFALACSRSAPTELGRKAAVQKPAAETAAQSASKDAREDGSGTRAKGEEGTLGAPEKKPASRYRSENLRGLATYAPLVEALPASPAPLGAGLAAGSGHGALASRGYALGGAAANAPLRQMISTQERAARRVGTSAERDAEAYASRTDNPFLAVKEHPLSTFSSDVDTASYSNAR